MGRCPKGALAKAKSLVEEKQKEWEDCRKAEEGAKAELRRISESCLAEMAPWPPAEPGQHSRTGRYCWMFCTRFERSAPLTGDAALSLKTMLNPNTNPNTKHIT